MKIKTIIIAVLSLFAVTASAQTTYLDVDGTQTTLTENQTTVTSSTTNWSNGWYVISEDITIADRISVSGTVNLILGNGKTLTASKGITVGSDAAFNIYAQSDDEATMGALVATAAENSNNAAIGGVNNTNFGTIVINGGKITATTSNGGAGIGGGYGSNGGSITINGGIVSATAGDYSNSAGIGGGNSGYVASVTLNGGIITATGDTHYGGAGIGTGAYAGSGTMTITIGSGVKKLVATKGDDSDCIGKESYANTTVNVVFKNGETTVEGDDKDAVFYDTGEGSVRQIRAKAMNHAVTMSNDLKANITANPEYALAGETVTLTLGAAVDASTLSVNDGTSDLTLTDAGNRQYTFTMPDGDVTVTATAAQSYAVTLPANMEVVSATNAADANGKYITGTTVTFKPMFGYEASDVSDGTNTLEPDANSVYSVTVATADITVTATVGRSATIDLTDASGDFTAINNDVLTGSTAHTVTITDGASITLNNATISGGIVCEGTATINLVGTNSVSGWNGYDSNIGAVHYSAGIQIGGSGTTLTINGDGSLTATGGDGSAGIGLNYAWNVTDDVVGGNIVINGGTITANGGTGGAGIGTSEIKDANNNRSRKAIIGNITITGGTVTAVGGSNADGIGSGKNAYGATIQIGTVTIYDGIDKVDASSIKDFANVVYKHGETNVTDNKTDYFTIGEDGDRRIITPKDDTDYTITIADGIENGTISAAATAKYMQMVTVTATPAFGYRLVRLIVKDGENNDVASTYNTFLMPKGNVTVSAEFALGSHGTTEFTWRYSTGEGPQDQVLETIYDGVTTVNIQQTERSYSILKYENEYKYSKFKLDNNTYEASIPYAGGTGEFYGTGNGTNFRIPYNGETGYYDITLTDAGNGKWSVSIQKTAAQMDVVPDQTYTGSEITPEPLVLAGSLSLTKGTDYTYSYENNTNVGTATVRATFQGDYESLGSVEQTFNIVKATPTVSVPTPINTLTYTGEAQPLVTAGSTDFGTLLYSVDGENYSADIPSATNVGDYTVYYKVDESGNWNAVDAQTVTVAIAPNVTQFGALTVTSDQSGSTATFDASSSETITITETIEVKTVIIKRTFTAERPSTMILPFECAASKFSGTFHTVTSVEYNKTSKQWEAKASAAVSTVEANKPYIFKPSTSTSAESPITINAEEDKTISLAVCNSTTEYTNVGKKEGSDEDSDWQLIGVYYKKTWEEDSKTEYGFSAVDVTDDGITAGEFVRAGSGAWINPMRCYLKYTGEDARFKSKSATELPQKIRVIFPDGTSSVIEPGDPETNGEITTPVAEIATNDGAKVWSYDGAIVIASRPGAQYQIVDINGRILKNGVTATDRDEITLSRRAAGIAIVIVNGKTFKVKY